jgi:hypothetical protein
VPVAAPLWAPRVSQALIRRLYRAEARGLLDEDLVDEVGVALYARCESILRVTEAHRGRIACGACAAVIEVADGAHWRKRRAPLVCPACGWATTWSAYLASYQKQRLHSGSAEPVFAGFLRAYPHARTPRQKMLAIDRLLHEFHQHFQFGLTRPAAANVIEGNVRDLLHLLAELAGERPAAAAHEWRSRAEESAFRRYLPARGED